MEKISKKSINIIAFWTIFIIVSGCFCFIWEIFPICNDDWWTLSEIKRGGIGSSLRIRFFGDAIRVGNMLGIITILLPKWITATFISICFMVGYMLMVKVCGLKFTDWKPLALLSFLLWVCPFWEDAMFSHMYAFNYIPSIALLFGAIYIFLNPGKCPLWASVIIGVLLGCWHESYSILFVCGAVLNFVLNRETFDRERIVLTICVAIGMLWIFLTPGIYRRSENMIVGYIGVARMLKSTIFFIFVFLWLWKVFVSGIKNALKPIYLFAFGSVPVLIIVTSTAIARANMPGILVTCCAMTVLLQDMSKRIPDVFKNIAASVLAVFTSVSLLATSIEAVKVSDMAIGITEAYFSASPQDKYAFRKVSYPWNASRICLRRPDDRLLVHNNRNSNFIYVYTGNNIMIVPEELKGFKKDEAGWIEGPDSLMMWKGHIISKNLTDTIYHNAFVDYNLRREYTTVESVIFETEDSVKYVYILPIRSTISTYLGDPKSIELTR